MTNRAWVTLATNDSYGLGALVLAHSLRRVGSTHSTVVLITPSVTDAMRDRLRAVFTEVVTVDVLDSRDAAHLALLQRPELGITFTKIHCWELTQYEKCVFLDADTLVVQNCDELFEREELSAAPDVGWPDCFNSGVFVYKPSAETFDALIKFARDRGSFDGGDQGLLNSFFSDWARGDINKHLPFLYNVTSAAFYSYLPALKHYGQDMKIIHFIGAAKPWLQPYNWESRSVDAPEHIKGLLQLWWDLFVGQVHQQLDSSMVEDVEVATPALLPPDVAQHYAPSLDPQSEFLWHHPDAQQDEAAAETVDITEYYDPWQNYRGNIPPNPSIEATDDRQAVRDYAWEYKAPAQNPNVWQPPSGYQHDTNWHKEPHHHHTHSYDHRDHHSQGDHSHIHTHGHQTDEHQGWCQEHEAGPFFTSHDNSSQHHNSEHDHGQHGHTNTQYPHDHHYDHTSHPHHDHNHSEQFPRHESSNDSQGHKHFGYAQDYHPSHDHNNSEQSQRHESSNDSQSHKELVHAQVDYDTNHSRLHVIHHVHIDYENTPIENREAYVPVATEDMNGFASETESCDHEDIKPRHPYDNYYLKHRASIDPYGRKICSHEIPPTPSPSPPPEPMSPVHPEEEIDESPVENQSGVAGNLARVVPGAAAREAVDELTRRQGWEAGNIDYMGADSFDNIWAKISQTLNQPRTSPPKQQSPPKEAPKQPSPQKEPALKQPSPPKEAPAEAKPAEAPVEVKSSETLAAPEPAEAPVEAKPAETSAEAKPAEVPVEAKTVEKPADVAEPVAEAAGKPTPVPPAVETPAAPAEAPAPVPVEAPTPAREEPVVASAAAPVEAAPAAAPAAEAPKEEIKAKTDKPEVPPTPPATPKSSPEPMTPVGAVPAGVEAMLQAAAPASPVPVSPTPVSTAPASSAPASSAPASPSPATTVLASQAPASPAPARSAPASPAAASSAAPPKAATPEKALDVTSASSDSPPLANTPLKEDAPKDPAAKSEERERRKPAEERERRMPAERLQLCPPAGADPLATPDSELEDAASLAHAIIASELAPPGAVSLAQIGVKSKGKSTAAHIESSVVDAPAVPATPTAEAPVIPKAEGPVTPSAQIPATPSAEAPATPSAVAPTTPSAEAPMTPSAKAPTTPSAEAPTTPSAKAPTTPSAKAPTIPSAKAPTTPSAKAPTTTSAEAPTTPIANAPATPSAEAPATPSADVPRTPSAEAPVTPSAEAPATPSAEAPATPSAEAPATPSAETPVTPSAEAPASPAAEAAPKDAPKKKIIKKVVKKEGDAPVPPPRKKEKKPKDK